MKEIPFNIDDVNNYNYKNDSYIKSVKRLDKWLDGVWFLNDSGFTPTIIADTNYIDTTKLDDINSKSYVTLINLIHCCHAENCPIGPVDIKKGELNILDIIIFNCARNIFGCRPIFYIIEYLDNKKDMIILHVFDIFTLDYSSFKISLATLLSDPEFCIEDDNIPLFLSSSALKYYDQILIPSKEKHVNYLVENYDFKFNIETIKSQLFSTAL